MTKPTCDDLEAENAAQLEARSARLAERVREVDARKNGWLLESIMETSAKAKQKREAAIKDWRWLLWDSDEARDRIHPELGAGWTAVLKEACCVRKDKEKEKVNRIREDGDRGPLRLWPSTEDEYGEVTSEPFKDMVVTVPLLDWCVRREYEPDAKTFEVTARGGDMDAIRWLRKHKCPWDDEKYGGNACRGAAYGGHLDVLKWLRKEGCPWNVHTQYTCSEAAKGGHLDVLKYAHENGCPWDEWTCRYAATGGRLDVLKYAHENGCPWDEQTCKGAAEGGHLNVLKYLRENGCPWDREACEMAAEGGHLNVLKYAHEHGCPWDVYTCSSAARGGHLDVLKYLHENGCPWNRMTCSGAARGGHLGVLKYARQNGCPWEKSSCLSVTPKNDVKQWIMSQPE